jgi:DNA-directed RNA polymerase subunit RPC12/RpoP
MSSEIYICDECSGLIVFRGSPPQVVHLSQNGCNPSTCSYCGFPIVFRGRNHQIYHLGVGWDCPGWSSGSAA